GLAGSIRRDTLTLAGAHRLTDSIALGLSLSTSRVAVTESRRMWAGDVNRIVFGVRQPDTLGDGAHDIGLAVSAIDNFAPNAVAGLLIAPEDSRIEIGLSLAWNAPARVHGDIASTNEYPMAKVQVATTQATARVEIEQPIIAHSGARWLGERVVA